MAHKIISTLLALQLLVSFGLCGGLCCLASVKASAVKAEVQKSEEPAAAMSHCPLHARKAAAAKSQHLAMAAMATASNQKAKAGVALPKASPKTVRKADCCIYRGSVPEAEPSQVTSAFQTHKHFALLHLMLWREGPTTPSQTPSPPNTILPSFPPRAGFQLSLRI